MVTASFQFSFFSSTLSSESSTSSMNTTTTGSGSGSGSGGSCGNCVFPFSFMGVEHNACTTIDGDPNPWCSTLVDETGVHVAGGGQWEIFLDSLLMCFLVAGSVFSEFPKNIFRSLGVLHQQRMSNHPAARDVCSPWQSAWILL